MKRNSMLTKIIAVLLCALMVAAWLPKTSAAANDYESGMDRDYGAHAGNAMDLLIGPNEDAGLADTYYAYTPAEDGTLTLTAEDGTTFTVDGVAYTEAVAVTAGTKYIIVATNAALAHSFTAAFEVAPTGPVYTSVLDNTRVALSMQDKINATFVYSTSKIKKEAYDRVWLEVKPYDADSEIVATTITEGVGGNNVYEFGVWSRQMADRLEVTLYAEKDGVTYCGNPKIWSVKEGAEERIATYIANSDSAQANLYVNMLNFGAAMQVYFNYRTEALANKDLTEAQQAYATAETPVIDVTPPTTGKDNYTFAACSLYLADRTGLQFVYRMPSGFDKSQYSVAVTMDDVTTMYPFGDDSTSNRGILIYSGLNAKQMRKEVTVQLYCGDAPVEGSPLYTASIAAVAKSRINGTNANLAAAAIAMMKYGDSVLAVYG